ncbi:kinase-like protein [Hymenopellis radicata]|nr:kinase-like protein [Hymenopellis radicata]
MRFIHTRTSVPVPRPLFTIHYRGRPYLFMTRVAGHVVAFEEFESLSVSVQEHIISQLAGYVAELRDLTPPPGTAISSILGGPVYDLRLKFDGRVGPFVDEEHMNLQARSGLSFREIEKVKGPTYDPDQSLMKSHAIKHPRVFTHGDLAERNLLFDTDYNLTGILDWESAGWFPSHWEYVKALWSLHPKDSAWAQAIERWIPPYKFEASADGFGLVDGLPPVDSYY